MRQWYAALDPAAELPFSDVTVTRAAAGDAVAGTLGAFARDAARDYRILVTGEADTEYAWALAEAHPGRFRLERPRPLGGAVRLRLVELEPAAPGA
ncbi:MAG: hypothetical protein U1E23_19735 [Reyranellaceae bacterium]